jgi:hypothetical protein
MPHRKIVCAERQLILSAAILSDCSLFQQTCCRAKKILLKIFAALRSGAIPLLSRFL